MAKWEAVPCQFHTTLKEKYPDNLSDCSDWEVIGTGIGSEGRFFSEEDARIVANSRELLTAAEGMANEIEISEFGAALTNLSRDVALRKLLDAISASYRAKVS